MIAPSRGANPGRPGFSAQQAKRWFRLWLAMYEFNVPRAGEAEADRLMEGLRAEIKFSTSWENGE